MILNHNMNALTALNKLNNNNINDGKAMEKLSSGLRINRAADDAAGLAISEKMRAQIRGLSQAQRNSQDGISLIQVADGAMSEITEILNRIRELSVQAANDTNVSQDRTVIQSEVDELLKEVSRITDNTEFNTIPLLDGEYNNTTIVGGDGLDKYVDYITSSGGVNDEYEYNGKKYASAIIDFSNLNSEKDIENIVGKGFNYTCCTCDKAYSIKFVKGEPDTSRLNDANPVMEVDVTGIANGEDLVKKIMSTAYGKGDFEFNPESPNLESSATSFVQHFSKLASDGGKLYIYDDREYENTHDWPKGNAGRFDVGVFGEPVEDKKEIAYIDIQVGANEGQNIRIQLPNTKLEKLKLEDPYLSVMSNDDAGDSIKRVDDAILYVNGERSRMGAYQNRLEHTINNISNTEENMQSSESKIRDADIAKNVLEHSKYSILTQAAQAMISQANEMPKAVLNLISSWK